MKFRKIIFWTHLVIGLAAGLVIAVSAFTGATMAFEKRIVAWCERKESHVAPPAKDAERWSLQDIVANIRDEYPEARPQSIVVSSDPAAVISVSLGRTNTVYVNPYTGDFQPQGARKAREFFQFMLRVHRWLGVVAPEQSQSNSAPAVVTARSASTNQTSGVAAEPPREGPGGLRKITSTIVGVSACIFFALCISGLYIWWPRKWDWRTLRPSVWFVRGLRGKPRDWNWHNAIGLWASPVLILTAFTGIVMAFRPVGDLIYKRPENENAGLKISTPEPGTRPLGPDALLAAAQKEVPDWETITLRLGGRRQRGGGMQRPQGENRTTEAVADSTNSGIFESVQRLSPLLGGEGKGEGKRDAQTNSASSAIKADTVPLTPALSPRERENRSPANAESRGGGARTPQPVSISVTEKDSWSPVPVQLQLDPYTGDVLRKERLSDFGFRRAFRAMNRSLHTGEAGGVIHQAMSLLACLGALALVWTGFAMAWRRFFCRADKTGVQ